MKKLALILLAALLSLSLFSCVAEEEGTSNINDYVAPNYTHKLTDQQGGGTITFTEGHADSAIIASYTGKSTPHAIEIPDTISESKRDVTGIGDEAFYQLTTIKSIKLPDSVTFIGKYAFAGCTALEEIVIPASVTYIDEGAFHGCTALKKVTFAGTDITSIGKFAFHDCTALTEITLPDGLESIGDFAFGNCAALTAFAAPSTLKTIGELAFYGCSGLNADGAVVLSSSIEKIGDFAFSGVNKNYISAPAGSYAAEYVSKMAEPETED